MASPKTRWVVLVALLFGAACGGEKRAAPPRDTGPVARPDCVVATLAIRDVAEIARGLSSLAGPLLPEGAARADGRLWATALADLPADAAEALAARGDAYVLLLDAGVAWALPLEGTREAAPLAAGDDRKARRAGRHLVVAPDVASLRQVAAWVERTLAKQPKRHAATLQVDAAKAAKASEALLEVVGALAAELRDEAHGMRATVGRPPELGEPEAVAGWVEDVGRRLARALGDAGIDAATDLDASALSLNVALDARAGSTLARDLAASSPGRLPLLAHVPADAILAVAIRRTPAERHDASARTVALLQRLAGARLGPGEAEAFGAALRGWDDSTGDDGAVAVFGSTPGSVANSSTAPTVMVESSTQRPDDAARAAHALAGALGQGHLALVGERIGFWRGAPALEVARLPDRLAVASGPDAEGVLDRASGPSLASRREVATVLAAGGDHLVSLGSASPTSLLALTAPVFGERFTALATAARTGATSEHAVWSLRVEGRRLLFDLRVPPPELRAIAAALR